MLQHLHNGLAKGVTALAVMLIAMLVVQTPVAMLDRALHASGQVHAVNAFGPLAADLADHDHDDQAADARDADDDRDPSPSQGAHHHHDGPSLLGLAAGVTMASPWAAAATLWPGASTSLASAEPSAQKRPPKAALEHVA